MSFVVTISVLFASVVICLAMIMAILSSKDEKSDWSQTINKIITIFSRNLEDDSRNMSVDEIISSLDEHALKSRESLTALRLLKFKLKNDKEKALEAIKLNLIDYCEKLIEVITTDDERFGLIFDVLNEILRFKESAEQLISLNNKDGLKKLVDEVVRVIRRSKSHSQIEKAIDISELDNEDNVEVVNENLQVCNPLQSSFMSSIYKPILTLGLLASHDESLQSIIADRGGLEVVIECLELALDNRVLHLKDILTPQNQAMDKFLLSSYLVVKWASWALIHIIFQHPGNKREFFVKRGLPIVLEGLIASQQYRDEKGRKEIYQQGMSLVYCCLLNDGKTKINMHQIRTQALNYGIMNVIEYAKKKFGTVSDIQVTIKLIETILLQEWL